jgi:hypothetical protein
MLLSVVRRLARLNGNAPLPSAFRVTTAVTSCCQQRELPFARCGYPFTLALANSPWLVPIGFIDTGEEDFSVGYYCVHP